MKKILAVALSLMLCLALMVPAMADGVESCAAQGIIASYVHRLTLENVRMRGLKGERLVLNSVDTLNDD